MNININKYTEKYLFTVFEYIDNIDKSEFINTLENKIFFIEIGFRAITNVFQINFNISKDIDTAYYSSKKAYLYYLEYLEQINKTSLCHDLNHTDAILFIYNKSIINYSNNKIMNALPLSSDFEFEKINTKISKFINISSQDLRNIIVDFLNTNPNMMDDISFKDISFLSILLNRIC
jgi:hypothetical protein